MYRLVNNEDGWIVQKKVKYFFGLKSKWVPTTFYSGLPDKPFHYSTELAAVNGYLEDIKTNIYYYIRRN